MWSSRCRAMGVTLEPVLPPAEPPQHQRSETWVLWSAGAEGSGDVTETGLLDAEGHEADSEEEGALPKMRCLTVDLSNSRRSVAASRNAIPPGQITTKRI